MTRVLDVDGTTFRHEEYVDYTHALTTGGVLAGYTVLVVVAGLYFASRVPQTLGWAVVYIGGVSAVYYCLMRAAWDEWDRAKSVRRWAETRQEAAPVFASIMATVVIEVLQKVAEAAEGGDA